MVDFWCQKWNLPLLLCLTGLLQWDLCSGQIQVQIQEGPLYRVKGYPISISCNVTGFTGPPTRDFQFILKKPNMELNIISTSDKEFAYGVFSGRVEKKEIYIQRLSGSSVLLWIKNLQENDAGDLLCVTLHTGGAYYGDYDDEAKLNVIADTLEASYSGSPSQSLSEGDPLQLECQVSSQTFQHTHLMVTWFLHGEEDENPRPIITLDRDLTVKPGAGFEDRYRAGLISMDKVEDTTYRLKMPQVQQSDQGKFFCKATEWIQDPDRSWTQIAHKTTTACDVEIKRIGEIYILSFKPEALRFFLQQPDFTLINNSQQSQICCYLKQFVNVFEDKHRSHSLPLTKKNDLAVVMAMKDAVTEGDALRVVCSVSGFKGPLSVSWQHKKDSGASFIDVISLTHEGVMKDVGSRYQSRNVQTFHSPAGNFTLELGASATSDSGEYKCIVSEWTVQSNGEMKKANTHSQQKAIIVNSVESLMKVSLKSRTSNVPIDSPVELLCIVRGPKVSLAVRWMFQPHNSTFQTNILSISHTGEMAWRADQRNYQLSIQAQPTDTHFTLKVPRASKQQEGQYQCQVDAYQKDVQKAKIISNPLAVIVQKPGKYSYLFIKIMYQLMLKCSVEGIRYDSTLRYSLTWMFNQYQSSSVALLTYSHDGRLKYNSFDSELEGRLHFSTPEVGVFHLTIHRSIQEDRGRYYCQVQQYQLDCKGQWSPMASDKSGFTNVTVQLIESKLHVQKDNRMLNITNHQTAFTIDCVIDSQSSDTSGFEVTWFKVQEEGPVTIFTARRDGILHSAITDKNLVFGRPLATHYKLTVPQISPTDVGQYYCQVEEWLLTANTWKRFASDKSGELSIYVHTEGDSEKQADPLGTTLGVTIPLICFLVLVIILLLRRDHKRNSELTKKKDCLWAENNPLTPVPEGTCAAEDHS
uniref:Ig-like domain-containing protein n=1 Tax=Cyprinus carpio TaxID=7962 RepID=A0A8C2I0Y6_CYPCA